ncbi:hypothetical protein E4U40_007792 [Claviceps sp. LM458 group G5]|nr:hypothetical protein E4U40_007792 [Claviceps sp. LM458 group G5]
MWGLSREIRELWLKSVKQPRVGSGLAGIEKQQVSNKHFQPMPAIPAVISSAHGHAMQQSSTTYQDAAGISDTRVVASAIVEEMALV